ncbi:uncharacterized protein ASCRUDRAFT_81649 [Ascoidea rubescens DSM 1968]|uniref:Uncharacterized protein n=1 Tax=Ascoidea rubescens DSM 1968 TaxID=1344418 RepID=A0A1D2VFD4_9ASCO|nr:hypothetical protein ASCRUDRAFT_81649 [Ascoidea rubescens DSM 1968]ODV60223.1 hypothetical protein ASCRUDRAFT_81649 [Ascoidea rubescens DSM 1968]
MTLQTPLSTSSINAKSSLLKMNSLSRTSSRQQNIKSPSKRNNSRPPRPISSGSNFFPITRTNSNISTASLESLESKHLRSRSQSQSPLKQNVNNSTLVLETNVKKFSPRSKSPLKTSNLLNYNRINNNYNSKYQQDYFNDNNNNNNN